MEEPPRSAFLDQLHNDKRFQDACQKAREAVREIETMLPDRMLIVHIAANWRLVREPRVKPRDDRERWQSAEGNPWLD